MKTDLVGKKFGRLYVVEMIDKTYYRCVCECGKEKIARKYNLTSLLTRSCGCLMKDAKKKHGLSNVNKRLYHRWGNMRSRCKNANHRDYKNYGGRGIKVCSEWDDYKKFYEWSMQNGYSDTLSLDRIDNDGGYSPSNCRWTDRETQQNNTRTNRKSIIDGNELTMMQISRKYDVSYSTVSKRYKEGKRGIDLVS